MNVFKAAAETVSTNWNRYFWSSFVTFISVFLSVLAIDIQYLEFSSLETAGISGSLLIISRLVIKAVFEGIKALIIWIADNHPSR
jgi:hypothetical protein